ncbi:MAG: hypothetical protein E6Q75_12125 [Rheinheimera sp.]|nr:MAG: hypothetical protein E6Q75_12125 [Rheinheimera sp.]
MKKIISAAFIPFFFAACTATGPQQVPSAVTNQIQNSQKAFTYAPEGREEFVFGNVSPALQKYAYGDVCFKMPVSSVAVDCLMNRLPYEKYVGKRGFFTDKAAFEDLYDHVVREAILETGEVIYVVKSKKYQHVGDTFIPLEEHNKISSFKPVPIVKGAKTIITGYSNISRGKLNVSSQNGHGFSEAEIEAIRNIASKYPKHSARLADLLSTLSVKVDDFDKKTIISHLPYNNKETFVSIRLVINEDGKYTPFIVVHYQAEDWLFVQNYAISADGFRWDSPKLQFERDHTGGRIWEWSTTSLDDDKLSMLEKLATATSAKIRFHGQQYYNDYELTPVQKQELSALVEVVKILKG